MPGRDERTSDQVLTQSGRRMSGVAFRNSLLFGASRAVAMQVPALEPAPGRPWVMQRFRHTARAACPALGTTASIFAPLRQGGAMLEPLPGISCVPAQSMEISRGTQAQLEGIVEGGHGRDATRR